MPWRLLMPAKTGRQLVMEWLQMEISHATTADLQRAASFLQFARDVRKGCTKQRGRSRRAQSNAWRKDVDDSIAW